MPQKHTQLYKKNKTKKQKSAPEEQKETKLQLPKSQKSWLLVTKVGSRNRRQNKQATTHKWRKLEREREMREKEVAIETGHMYCFSCETDKEKGG